MPYEVVVFENWNQCYEEKNFVVSYCDDKLSPYRQAPETESEESEFDTVLQIDLGVDNEHGTGAGTWHRIFKHWRLETVGVEKIRLLGIIDLILLVSVIML